MSIGTIVMSKKLISTFKSYPLNYFFPSKDRQWQPMVRTLKPNCISQDTAILALPPFLVLCVPSALITALPTPPSALTLANPIVLDPTVSAVSPNYIEVPAIVIAAPSGISVWPSIMKPSIMKPSISSPEARRGECKSCIIDDNARRSETDYIAGFCDGWPPMVPSIAIVLGERCECLPMPGHYSV